MTDLVEKQQIINMLQSSKHYPQTNQCQCNLCCALTIAINKVKELQPTKEENDNSDDNRTTTTP